MSLLSTIEYQNGYSDLENEGYELALKESFIDNDIFEYLYQDTLNKE